MTEHKRGAFQRRCSLERNDVIFVEEGYGPGSVLLSLESSGEQMGDVNLCRADAIDLMEYLDSVLYPGETT